MGGYRSSRWGPWPRKITVEACAVVDALHWAHQGSSQRDPSTIQLTRTPCHYGGQRPWFICPASACARRVRKLYRPPEEWEYRCRRCWDLAYERQRRDWMTRRIFKAMTIRERLGGHTWYLAPFPEKPRGMHWRTYDRLWWEAHMAVEAFVEAHIRRSWRNRCGMFGTGHGRRGAHERHAGP